MDQYQKGWAAVLALLAITQTPPSYAQERRVLEEVIVTAQKRAQSLQDIPMSVSAIGGDMAAEAAIVDTSDLVQYTPNVKFTAANPAYSSTSIRGFGTPPLARNLEPSVGLVIDGISYGRSTFTNDGVFDLERLEVLRGPQGTLFGKNTVAGVLNFTTASPTFDLTGYATVAKESLDGRRYEAAVGFPIIDDVLAGRISWRKRDKSLGIYNTTRNNEEEGYKDESVRLKLDWFPHEGVEVKLIAFKSEFESVGNGFQHSKITPTGFEVYREADPQTEDDEFDDTRAANSPSFTSRFSDAVALSMAIDTGDNWVFRNATLTTIASWAQIDTPFQADTDFGPVNVLRLETDGPERYRQEQIELRYTADSDPLFGWGESVDWVLGLFAGKSQATATQFTHQNLAGIAATAPLIAEGRGAPNTGAAAAAIAGGINALAATLPDGGEDSSLINYVNVFAETYALFAQADWHLSNSLTTSIGLRLGKETKDGANGSYSASPVAAIFAGQENFENEGSITEYEVSPKLAISWSPNDQVTMFGNIAKGFKSGGFSGPLIAPVNVEYEAEEALSSEIGIKSRLFEQTLELNATVYKVDFDNFQLNLFDGTQISTANTGEASSWGMEIDFQWLPPMPWLTVQGSVGFNETKYGHFPCGPTTWDDRDAAPECGEDAPPSQDLSGERLAFVPETSASLTPTVRFPIWPSREIGAMFAIDIIYQGDHYLDPDLDEETYQQATTKINARLAIAPANKRWSIIFNAKNLTEEQERLLVLDVQQQGGNYTAITRPDEAQYSLDLRYNFGPLD